MGKVAFGCVDDIEIPIGSVTCRTYTSTAMETPPKFRIMGDVWNVHVLGNSSVGKSFEKNLHPCTPIIQMYGLICGEGSSGGPVFNVKGEVVGMVSGSASGYEYAIHVATLREILRLFKEQNPGNEDWKRKDSPNPEVQGRDSKKFKPLPTDQKGKGKVA
ncbi:uncharacterized protein [Nicotiana tomentosiformis]|uniref:uncharacterized protein isoform X4 n=1 Tax=Nicotiana tomentosiformis TaxID=4098 RepID=UPI00051C0239|nr:uncharacterized protein LOC104102571 [Nicotiana tomentosiformis]